MSSFRSILLIVLTTGVAACDEHTALNATAKIDLPPPAITPNTVELVLVGQELVWPDGQRADLAELVTQLVAEPRKVALTVCQGTPHETVVQTVQTLRGLEMKVTVDSAAPARCD